MLREGPPAGSDTYFVALFGCICEAANCKTECAATLCNETTPANPDTACNTCMQGKNANCQKPVATACAADTDCVAFDACVSDSSCASKR